MPGTSEITSDYSGSLTASSSEEEEEEPEDNSKHKLRESTSLLWTGTGSKKCPVIIFRPESLVNKDRKLKAVGEKYHLAYKMVKTESKLVRSVLSTYGFHEVHPNSSEFNLMWTGAHLKPFSLRNLQDFQKVNHFPRSYEITRKDRLYKNIERMAHTKGAKHFDFIPKSYLMPSEYQDFCAAYVKEKGSWIVKPIASSRGRGIYLINNPNQVPLEDNIMVCKYISNPLLIDGFKFDVRVYIAITSYDPLMIYLFEEGLTRFATVKYEKTNKHLKNQMMHLTNYSINKKSHDYVRCEDPEVEDYGNKWSMSAMLRYLKQEGIDTTTLMARIEGVIIKSIIAAELPIATACKMFVPHKDNCIELYGFDILIDENLKPWILEGNLSPSLACDAPLDLKIKSSMIADFFSIAGFRCVDPMTRRANKKQMDLLQRPYSAQRSASIGGAAGRGNKRPSSAGYKDLAAGAAKSGLSPDEARILLMAKEQFQRRGGFVRIFPTVETWDLYGSFLEYKSNMNSMLAQKLFPDSRGKASAYSSAVARIRNISSGQMLEGRHHILSERYMQYERKLFSLESYKKRRSVSSAAAPKKSRNKQTPVGIDNKKSKRAFSRNYSSSEAECSDQDEGESVTTNESKSSKARPKAKRHVSSILPETTSLASKSQKSTTQSFNEKALPVKSNVTAKPNRTEVNPQSGDAHDILGKQTSQSDDVKTANPASKRLPHSAPAQRVYMYKSNNLIEHRSNSSAEKLNGFAEPHSSSGNRIVPGTVPNPSADGDLSIYSPRASSAKIGSIDNAGGEESVSKAAALKLARNNRSPKLANVLGVLKSGGNLGKLQARQAFSAYLSRVQHRLKLESEGRIQEPPDTIVKQEEQMDLVLRFLKRAAGNLCQPFTVVVPSRRLSIIDRKRILSKQLGEFVRIYNKESDVLEHKNHLGLDKDHHHFGGDRRYNNPSISSVEFRTFISSASEPALEEVLTAYTHINKSASVFLGASKSRSPSARYHEKDEALSSTSETSMNGSLGSQQAKAYGVSSNRSLQNHRSFQHDDLKASPKEKSHHSSSTSLHQANYIYGAKSPSMSNLVNSQTRPSSAKPFMGPAGHLYTSSHSSLGRPMSASNRPLGNSIHHQTAANQEAISDALQRLTERQAARQYSASVQLTALSKHLSNLNLANMTSNHHHRIGSSEAHYNGNGPQRTASLCDLASIDPAVHSMVDPGQNKFGSNVNIDAPHEAGERSGLPQSHEALYSKSPQMLSQQSSALLQQSKAKHQAMLAQMARLRKGRRQLVHKWEGQVSPRNWGEFLPRVCNESFVEPEVHQSQTFDSRTHRSQFNNSFAVMADVRKNGRDFLRTRPGRNSRYGKQTRLIGTRTPYTKQEKEASRGITQLEKDIWGKDSSIPIIQPMTKHYRDPKYKGRGSRKITVDKRVRIKSKRQDKNTSKSLSQPFTQHFRNPNTEKTVAYYEDLLRQFNDLFEKGALSSKHWKEQSKAHSSTGAQNSRQPKRPRSVDTSKQQYSSSRINAENAVFSGAKNSAVIRGKTIVDQISAMHLLRPPPAPRPPERPRINDRPFSAKKFPENTRLNRPTRFTSAPRDSNSSPSFYESIKHDSCTGATKVHETAHTSDGNSNDPTVTVKHEALKNEAVNSEAINSEAFETSLATKPMWKP